MDAASCRIGQRLQRIRSGDHRLEFRRIHCADMNQRGEVTIGDFVETRLVHAALDLVETGVRLGEVHGFGLAGGEFDRGVARIVADGLAGDLEHAAIGARRQGLFLKFRLLHQPVGDAAIERHMRTTAFKAARPEPALIRKQHGNATFALAVQHQQWVLAGAEHDCLALRLLHADSAEPATPMGWLVARAFQAACDRVLLSGFGKAGEEGALIDLAGRLGGQHRFKRRHRNRILARMFGACGNQERAALFHILSDVIIIEDRQHAAMLVAVEDDQIEIVDLFDEEFTRWESDQRQFIDRRSILLFRRTQNGEVNEVYGGVGLQQVAPGALTGMRLTGDEQHTQVLANALDDMDGAVVGGGDFARQLGDGEFHHVVAAARNLEGEGNGASRHGLQIADFLAVHLDGDIRRAALRATLVEDAQCELLLLIDDAEAGRANDLDATIEFIGAAGDQAMDRRLEAKRLFDIRRSVGNVVDLTVAEEDRATDAGGRDIRDGGRECREEVRRGRIAVLIVANLDDTRLDAGEAGKALPEICQRLIGLRGALLHVLALRPVDDHRHDGGERLTLLIGQQRIGDGEQKGCKRKSAQPCAAHATQQTGDSQNERGCGQNGDDGPGEEGGE